MNNNFNNNQQNFVPPQQTVYNSPQNLMPTVAPQYVSAKPKKVYSPLEKKDKRFLPLFLIPTLILADFLATSGFKFNLEFTVFCFVQFIVSAIYLYDKKIKPTAFTICCGILSLLGSVTFTLFSDGLINFFMLVLVGGLYGLFCLGLSGKFTADTGSYRIMLDLIFDTLVRPFKSFSCLIGAVKAGDKKEKKNLSALFGVLLAVPVLLVVVPLLIKSDAAFEGLVKGLSENVISLIIRLVLVVFILPYFVSYAYSKSTADFVKPSHKRIKRKSVPYSAGISFLCVISIVYAVFIFSQLAYFFSAFSGVLPEGYTLTASAFARRGFFEMFAICCINIAVVSAVLALCKRNEEGEVPLSIKLLSLFISVFDFVLLISAAAKMVMNVRQYDLSRNRVLVCTFMLMIAVILVFFTVHIFSPKVPYMRSVVIICSVIFIAMSYSDINSRIAEYNVREYKNSGISSQIDIDFLEGLGSGAVESLIMVSNDKNKAYADTATDALILMKRTKFRLDFDENAHVKLHDWRSFNLSNYKAMKAIEENCEMLKEHNYERYLQYLGKNPLYDSNNGYRRYDEDDTYGYDYQNEFDAQNSDGYISEDNYAFQSDYDEPSLSNYYDSNSINAMTAFLA